MQKADLKTKVFILVCIIIAIITIGLYIYKQSKEENSYIYTENFETNDEDIIQENAIEQEETITIHITGEVEYPGVVVLKNGDRIVDAIEAAGGETENADLDRLNLAYILSDGDKIHVPNKNDENTETEEITTENAVSRKKETSININTATLEELTQLPGIGEATANKIIEYRKQNGKFKTIEEIKNVPGIGDSKFENLKDKIKIN